MCLCLPSFNMFWASFHQLSEKGCVSSLHVYPSPNSSSPQPPPFPPDPPPPTTDPPLPVHRYHCSLLPPAKRGAFLVFRAFHHSLLRIGKQLCLHDGYREPNIGLLSEGWRRRLRFVGMLKALSPPPALAPHQAEKLNRESRHFSPERRKLSIVCDMNPDENNVVHLRRVFFPSFKPSKKLRHRRGKSVRSASLFCQEASIKTDLQEHTIFVSQFCCFVTVQLHVADFQSRF